MREKMHDGVETLDESVIKTHLLIITQGLKIFKRLIISVYICVHLWQICVYLWIKSF